MACNTCGHTMQGLVTQENYKIFWCPRCGHLKSISGKGDNEFIEDSPSYWGKNVRDAARLAEIKPDIIKDVIPVSADFNVVYQNMENEKSVSIEMIKSEINYR